MIQTLKVLSLLLTYPTRELCSGIGELRGALDQEAMLTGKPRKALEALMHSLESEDIYDLQEEYVLLFDRTKNLSLHLFEHVHGEGRDRGQAMVNLKEVYEKAGLAFATNELPDFVPAFLEFLSTLKWSKAKEHLARPAHIFAALKLRLQQKASPYASVFAVLEKLADVEVAEAAVAELLQSPTEDPTNLEELDKTWEDAAVEFGPGAALQDGCSKVDDMLKRMEVSTEIRE